jgi:hypothetical protein
MSRLVVVVPLHPGSRAQVKELLAQGPPFDLAGTEFDRHDVLLTDEEAIFSFEGEGPGTLRLPAEDPVLWRAAERWRPFLAGRPRVAALAFSWVRPAHGPGSSDEWSETWGE